MRGFIYKNKIYLYAESMTIKLKKQLRLHWCQEYQMLLCFCGHRKLFSELLWIPKSVDTKATSTKQPGVSI